MKKHKVIALLSGGLDSTLAAKMMLDQGLEVIGFNMTSIFCTCTPKKSGCPNLAAMMAKQLGIKIIFKAKGEDYMDVIRNPKFGYGSGINPCIDCRIYVFKKAKELMEKEGALAIVTGEVLGQRPMSQRMDAIIKIEKESGLVGKILRPLSAQHFPKTEIEKLGIVDRSKLLDISGRQRKQQLEMANSAKLEDVHCGAGGCLLTDKNMKKRMLDLFAHKEKVFLKDLARLKVGRHFRLDDKTKFVLGRNESENDFLSRDKKDDDLLLTPKDFAGPSALVESNPPQSVIDFVCNVIASFSKLKINSVHSIKANERELEFKVQHVDYEKFWIKDV